MWIANSHNAYYYNTILIAITGIFLKHFSTMNAENLATIYDIFKNLLLLFTLRAMFDVLTTLNVTNNKCSCLSYSINIYVFPFFWCSICSNLVISTLAICSYPLESVLSHFHFLLLLSIKATPDQATVSI